MGLARFSVRPHQPPVTAMAHTVRDRPNKTVTRVVSFAVLASLAFVAWWASGALQTAIVPSASMEPTLRVDDLLMVRKDAFREAGPRRGDIVLFLRRGEPDYFVKRVVGLPGETVVVASGWVNINGKWLEEPYAASQRVRERPLQWVLGDDEYFLLGDNRSHSEDSRDFGAVKRADITGLVTSIIAPAGRRGRLSNPFDAR
ncbi:MAG TPA: signal peptidase I [Armatimonadetes bacterium]|jgi:signal peptidase I|nr:signal peptidase I [Armatimonadota bacterium]